MTSRDGTDIDKEVDIDKEIDKEREIDKEKEIKKKKKTPLAIDTVNIKMFF